MLQAVLQVLRLSRGKRSDDTVYVCARAHKSHIPTTLTQADPLTLRQILRTGLPSGVANFNADGQTNPKHIRN